MTLERKIQNALLVLEDGQIFKGFSIGSEGYSVGEVVFNTSMTGYQEILTDPSYCKQLVTLTYPHIGNTGVNSEDEESSSIWASGLVIKDYPKLHSNFRSETDLSTYLKQRNIVAIAGIDTRHLTATLRDKGSQRGCIITSNSLNTEFDAVSKQALEYALNFSGLKGLDLAKEVTTDTPYHWQNGLWSLNSQPSEQPKDKQYKVVAYDFGVKRNILRILVERGCDVHVVPAITEASTVLAMKPDGIFLSNGPGDPEPCDYAITAIKQLLKSHIPIFGICLGHQLLGLASGAVTKKMKFGHHGANHPVQDIKSSLVYITSQNHGFEVDEITLPECLRITHRSLFDQSLQGIERNDCPAFGFQGHPEASPGPHDIAPLFDHFIKLIQRYKRGNNA